MNTYLISEKIRHKGGEILPQASDDLLSPIRHLIASLPLLDYIKSCLTERGVIASGVGLVSRQRLFEENMRGVSPGGFLNPYGYLVIATSSGGNAVVSSSSDDCMYWADHTSYFDDEISYKNRETGDWITVPMNRENMQRSLVKISDSFDSFIDDLLEDKMTELLSDLDH